MLNPWASVPESYLLAGRTGRRRRRPAPTQRHRRAAHFLTSPVRLPTVRRLSGDPAGDWPRENGKPVQFRRCPRNGSRVKLAPAAAHRAKHPLRASRGKGVQAGSVRSRSKARRPACQTRPATRRASGRTYGCGVPLAASHVPPNPFHVAGVSRPFAGLARGGLFHVCVFSDSTFLRFAALQPCSGARLAAGARTHCPLSVSPVLQR